MTMNTFNLLPQRHDPDTVHAGPQSLRRRVSSFSTHDLQQLLCEAMEALEQLDGYSYEVQRLISQWRRSSAAPATDEEAASYEAEPRGNVWEGGETGPVDDEGRVSVLPTLYAADGYQIEEKGKIARVDQMSRSDLMQALCQSVQTLNTIYGNLKGLTTLVEDWRRGALRGAEHFALVP